MSGALPVPEPLTLPEGWRNDPKQAEKVLQLLRRAREKRLPPLEFASPLDLLEVLDPTTVRTPALEYISAALVEAYNTPDARLMISMPPQEGKLVADDTPVPTPTGWTRHGDLAVGDMVLHPSGRPVRVTAVHAPAEASLRVDTSDHGSVYVHPRHEWTVFDRATNTERTIETQAMARVRLDSGSAGRGHRYRFMLPLRGPFTLPETALPMDAYTLGVWLGDGTTSKGAVTHHPDDMYTLPYTISSTQVHQTTGIVTDYYTGLWADLRATGVAGNKHIPTAYLRASEMQRRALLAGLIDTDGHQSASGQVSFDNANEALVRQVAELIRTLGYRAHVHEPTPPKLSSSGIQGVQEMWRVTYTPHDVGPARLLRKAPTNLAATRRRIAITTITEVAPRVGRCITVDSEDGLYLVGETMLPTHNSHLATKAATLWQLIRNPELKCGILSYGAELATGFGREIRNWIASNNGAQGTLDLRLRLAKDNNAAARWQLAGHRGGLISVSLDGSLTGRSLDSLVIDDPFKDAQQAASAAYREAVWSWWQAVANTRLSAGAPVVVIMTRWHEDDIAGRLLKAEDAHRWRVISIPAQADHDPNKGETDPLGREPGEFMVSARGRDLNEWEQKKIAVGSRVWTALYQGKPSPDDGDILKRNWFRRYVDPIWSTDGVTYRIADGFDEMLTSWDMAFKDTKGSDYVVGQVWMRRGPDAFLLDQVRARLDFTASKKAVLALGAKWPQARIHLVEEKANGPAVITSLRKDAAALGAIIPVNPKDSKIARASAIAPFLESGAVHIPADAIALFTLADNSPETFLSEAAAFPNGAHDDQVDGFTQAMDRFFITSAGAEAWAEALRARATAETTAAREVRQVIDLSNSLDPLAEARRAQLAQFG